MEDHLSSVHPTSKHRHLVVRSDEQVLQETIGVQAKQWKSVTNRATLKEKYKGAQGFLDRIRSLVEDVSYQYHYQYINIMSISTISPASTRSARHLHLDDQWGTPGGLPQDPRQVKLKIFERQ